ncbi:FtsK/SpoIIIE domain-containing protein [Leucobacter sp. HY1908]
MKLRVALRVPGGGTHDVTLSCDVTSSVADLARALIGAGFAADPLLVRVAGDRLRPVTVRGCGAEDEAPVLLDPGSPIIGSGLQSGWTIEPVAEFGDRATARVVEPAGYVEVLSGAQAGALYSLVPGPNLLGRDQAARVIIADRSVSRRHALLTVAPSGEGELRDLGSANGTTVVTDSAADSAADSASATGIALHGVTDFELGGVLLRFTPGPPGGETTAAALRSATPHESPHHTLHMRSPRVDPEFSESTRQLPAPPAPAPPARIPMLAMLAPAIMGAVLFAVTRSPMSLMMMAFSPVMMIGSWVDGRFGARRKRRREGTEFRAALSAERAELTRLRDREIAVRGAETPTFDEVAAAIGERWGLLWARRPEHDGFGEVRFGEGLLPSRTALSLPDRGDSEHEAWEAVRALQAEFASVHGVPALERLDACGAIGVAGRSLFAAGLARSLVLQLAGLHSPAELVLACFAGPAAAGGAQAWEWLKWLPHVDTVTSPVPAWQLADDAASSTRLLLALEGLIESRRAAAPGAAGAGTAGPGAAAGSAGAGVRPRAGPGGNVRTLPVVVVLVLTTEFAPPARLIGLAEDGPAVGVHVIWVASAQSALPAACRTFVTVGAAAPAPDVLRESALPEAVDLETTAPEVALPATATTATAAANGSEVGYVRDRVRVPLSSVEYVDEAVAVRLARALAPVEDVAARALDESDLPRAVPLRELHPVDLTAGAAPIVRAWEGTLTATWKRGTEREPVALAAPVGQGPDGPATIDLRLHGPHALVGGTTGAGKSEFLQTWIMSLATLVSPDRLTFLLVDYKGGAAFAECVDLPHTVGLVTDLSPHLVRRALTSLRAELRYREELLAEHGAKDLATMERRSDPAAPPTLVIVVDEFAALASEVPEFVDGVVDVAQRGRSLGLHLILATQRPAGVIKDNLRANTNLRVALRMADEADSSDVIGVKDAAFFGAETPGRGAIKVGPGRIAHFQAGYLGGRQLHDATPPTLELRTLGFSEGPPWALPAALDAAGLSPATPQPQHDGSVAAPPKPPRDIERLRDGIVEAARLASVHSPRKPWLDVLPDLLDLAQLRPESPRRGTHAAADTSGSVGAMFGGGGAPHSATAQPGAIAQPSTDAQGRTDAVAVGVADLPAQQAQHPVMIDLEQAGNVAVYGASGSGKTSALITLAAALSQHPAHQHPAHQNCANHPVELYAIDAGGGALDALRSLPSVSTVAQLADTELVGRVLQRVLARLTERANRYAAARCSGLAAYRATPAGTNEPRIVLLVDGFAALRQAAEALGGPIAQLQQLTEIMTTGRAAGVHVVVTADRPGAMPAALAASVQQQFVLRLANPHDYASFSVPADVLEGAAPGRAVLANAAKRASGGAAAPIELQFAIAGGAPDLRSQTRAVERLAAQLQAAGVPCVPELRNAPDRVPLRDLPVEAASRPVYGISTDSVGAHVISVDAVDADAAGTGAASTEAVGAAGGGSQLVESKSSTAGSASSAVIASAAGTAGAAAGFAPVGLPVAGLGVIAGPSGAGVTTAATTCVVAYSRWARARGETVRCVLLTFAERRDRGGSGGSGAHNAAQTSPNGYPWNDVACGEDEVRELARALTIELGGKPPQARGHPAAWASPGGSVPVGSVPVGSVPIGSATAGSGLVSAAPGGHAPVRGPGDWAGADPEQAACDARQGREQRAGPAERAAGERAAGRPAEPRTVIVVERPADAEGTTALAELVALAKAARRADALVLFEFEQGTGSAIWDLFAALKQPTWGLALQPDETESQSPFRENLGRVKRANFARGRGFAIERGRVTPVHVALT